jgi:hypothetical protein
MLSGEVASVVVHATPGVGGARAVVWEPTPPALALLPRGDQLLARLCGAAGLRHDACSCVRRGVLSGLLGQAGHIGGGGHGVGGRHIVGKGGTDGRRRWTSGRRFRLLQALDSPVGSVARRPPMARPRPVTHDLERRGGSGRGHASPGVGAARAVVWEPTLPVPAYRPGGLSDVPR